MKDSTGREIKTGNIVVHSVKRSTYCTQIVKMVLWAERARVHLVWKDGRGIDHTSVVVEPGHYYRGEYTYSPHPNLLIIANDAASWYNFVNSKDRG